MDQSILDTIKKLRGIAPENTDFDVQLIVYINTAFALLNTLGIGPNDGFSISDNTVTWEDYTEDSRAMDPVQSYINIKVGLLFDPPTSSSAIDASNGLLDEIEWRLYQTVGGNDVSGG